MSITLTDKATQVGFAGLVGVSRQAIQKQCEKKVLRMGQTYEQWLKVYCQHLREEAAGRGGDAAQDLTTARIAESQEKTLAMRYDRLEREGELLIAEDVSRILSEVFGTVRSQVSNAESKVLEGLRSQHQLDVDDEFIRAPFRLALESAAKRAAELGQDIIGDDTAAGTTAT